jgi:CHAT domain-containing protein
MFLSHQHCAVASRLRRRVFRNFLFGWLAALLSFGMTEPAGADSRRLAAQAMAEAKQAEQGRQPEAQRLELGKPVERELAGGQSHAYQIALAEGQFLQAVAEQRGIDVTITLLDPAGNNLVDVNSPNGTKGPESVLWVAATSGAYRLIVSSQAKEAVGRYEVKIVNLRAATAEDKDLAEAARLNQAAVKLRGQGKYDEAIPLVERSLSLREKHYGPEHQEVAEPLNTLATILYFKEDYQKAEAIHLRALMIREKTFGPSHPYVANSLSNLALIYVYQGEYAKAEPLHLRALDIRERELGPEDTYFAHSLNNLAILYDYTGDYMKAESYYKRVLAIWDKTLDPEHPNVAAAVNNLAEVYRTKGDYALAEPLYQRALRIWEKTEGPEHPDVAMTLSNLAEMYRESGAYTKAEEFGQRALKVWEKTSVSETQHWAYTLNNLGMTYHLLGDFPKAESFLSRALEMQEKKFGPEHPDVANSLSKLALLYQSQQDYSKAESYLRRALTISEKVQGTEHPNVSETLYRLALLQLDRRETKQAVAFLARSNEARELNLTRTLVPGSERQKLLYLNLFSSETSSAVSTHLQYAPTDPQAAELALTTVLRRKGRGLDAMSDTIAALRRRSAQQDQAILNRLSDLRAQLASLIFKGVGETDPAEYQSKVKHLEGQIDGLETEISAHSAEFRAQFRPVTLKSVRAAIPQDSALVEFAVYSPYKAKTGRAGAEFGEPHYAAYVLHRDGEIRGVELGPARVIDDAIRTLRRALRNPRRSNVRPLARSVDERVMRPVRTLLGEARRLLLSPDGALNLLPFAALIDERNRYLIESYEFSYLTSGRDLLRLQVPVQSKQEPVIIAGPAFGERDSSGAGARDFAHEIGTTATHAFNRFSFRPLPGAAAEGSALQRILIGATFLTGERATKAALKQLSGPKILHVATHGFFLEDLKVAAGGSQAMNVENPLLRSGLALAGANKRGENEDGILTALEVASLDLWGTKLVALSACDTGVGEVKNGDGVYGLRRALTLAGAESSLMSLWPVSDRGTRDLMVAYYKGLQRGEGRGEALRQVQLRMLRQKARSHPYYWASFIQSGEWANLAGERQPAGVRVK